MRRALRWIFRLTLAAALAVALGYLPFSAFGPDGIAQALRLEQDLSSLEQKNEELRQENRDLQRQVNSLRKDRGAIERVARDELGMVRPEDIVFLFE